MHVFASRGFKVHFVPRPYIPYVRNNVDLVPFSCGDRLFTTDTGLFTTVTGLFTMVTGLFIRVTLCFRTLEYIQVQDHLQRRKIDKPKK